MQVLRRPEEFDVHSPDIMMLGKTQDISSDLLEDPIPETGPGCLRKHLLISVKFKRRRMLEVNFP